MSADDQAAFDGLEARLRAAPGGEVFIAGVKDVLKTAAEAILAGAKVVGPIALEIGEEALIAFATSELEKHLKR